MEIARGRAQLGRGFGAEGGFTLLELGLAVTMGLLLTAAGILAFDFSKDASGDAIARGKINDLQSLIETDFSTYGNFPALAPSAGQPDIRTQWAARRPNDFNRSPWGDVMQMTNSTDNGVGGLDGSAGLPLPAGPGTIGGAGAAQRTQTSSILYYYRFTVPGQPAPIGWNLWDASLQSTASVFAYAVASNKKHQAFYFVVSGRQP